MLGTSVWSSRSHVMPSRSEAKQISEAVEALAHLKIQIHDC